MMYKIKAERSEACLISGVIEYEGAPVMTLPVVPSTVISCKDSEEVLREISRLLDEISEGKVTSITIIEL